MKLTVFVISTDEAWKRSTSGELTERGFEVISQNEDNRFPQCSPDAIVLDLTDYDEALDALVQGLHEEFGECPGDGRGQQGYGAPTHSPVLVGKLKNLIQKRGCNNDKRTKNPRCKKRH